MSLSPSEANVRREGAGIHLATLGPIALTGPDPAACARVMTQPKRLALLAYLAARPAGEMVRRDRILAAFWPELPGRRAQGNLRNALYYLRRELGVEAIVSLGNIVGISPAHFACDAATFLADSLDASPALLELYRGEFLDALHVADAPDFERWVDRTRAAVRARATAVAWELADRAEAAGEWISATGYARRAAYLAVDVEGATQRLIQLLLRAGDGGAAVAEYERLAARLDEEFGIPPSPETSALVATIRGRRAEGAAPPAPTHDVGGSRPRSLAVLPFEDLGEGSGTYLADGLAEELLTALARIRGVRVVSRTSVRQFAAEPPASMRAVGDLLGVDLVLEGSVQQQGGRCRITVQLIDARRDEHLWAETYDRRVNDIFVVQSDVALRVARALEAELSPREHRRLRRPPTASLRAWQLYLKGRELWGHRDPGDTARVTMLFRRALELDDAFAAAWVGLADALLTHAMIGAGSLDALRAAQDAIQRALACDPESGEARATLGLILSFCDPDPPAAEIEYRRAVELSPGCASAHQWYGNWLCAFGRADEGLAELAVAIDLDPLSPAVSESLGIGLYHAGQIAEAESQFRLTLERDPDYWRGPLGLALCSASRGDLRAATRELVRTWVGGGFGGTPAEARDAGRVLERDPPAALEVLRRGAHARVERGGMLRALEVTLLVLLERPDEAVAAIEAGRGDPAIGFLIWFGPALDPLAEDARFRRLMEDANLLLPRWRRSG